MTEFLDPSMSTWGLISATVRLDMFSSLEEHIAKYAKDKKVQDTLKWPVIFLGASPKSAPAMYSSMTHGGHMLGAHYPVGHAVGGSGADGLSAGGHGQADVHPERVPRAG